MLISFAGAAMVPTLASSSTTALRPATPVAAALASSATVADADDVGTLAKVEPAIVAPAPAIDEASVECIAKVVRHEAANQPERGQLAVAQLIVMRTTVGDRFGRTPCAVVDQPGQFFDADAYNPDRHSPQWDRAVAAARDALGKVSPPVVPGALFYHAANSTPPRFFRSRARVGTLGDHIFYR
ncbi:MAG: cell wall hydrolase [Sphingomonas sp.]|uniref:cell wall hydrolase n=1 Tax=Sphingomonas sp. TaxID=28214 RepID=UPI001AC0C848|nr:cell wall hydrolase [Sphingomonas sp.]MBN8807090.1 cell wall hydrolase [Sphingomonas sp.]